MKTTKNASSIFIDFYKKLARSAAYSAIGVSAIIAGCGGGETCVVEPPITLTPEQIKALTPAQTKALRDVEIIAMGDNFKLMNDQALSTLEDGILQPNPFCYVLKPQIFSISPDQIASLSVNQVRKIGSADNGIAKLGGLSDATFDRLISIDYQVSSITPGEYLALHSERFTTFGDNIKYLSNPVFAAMSETYKSARDNLGSHIELITPDQIALLSMEQIQIMGTSDGGSSKFRYLNDDTYRRLMSVPENISLITPYEVKYLNNANIVNLGANIKYLSDEVLHNFQWKFNSTKATIHSQIGTITPEQVQAFSPHQIMILASLNENKGLAHLERLSFAALLPSQVTTLVSQNLDTVTAAQLASLREETIAAIPLEARQSLTKLQKSLLTASQAAYFV